MKKETKTAVFDQKEVLELIKSDLEAVEAFLSKKEKAKDLKKELETIETTINTLTAVGAAVPKELEEKHEELKTAIKSVELSEEQSILLRYLQKKLGLQINAKTKTRLNGTVVITTVDGKKFEYESFKRACLHLGLDVGKDSAKRVLLRAIAKKTAGLENIQSVAVGGQVIWERTAE